MQPIISYSILILIFFFLKILFKNLKSKFHQTHQKFAGRESVPLIGGIIMFCFYSYDISVNDLYFFLFSFLILLLGISSDNNFLQSPKLRLVFQTLILSAFVYSSGLQIEDLRNDFFNLLISNYYFGLFFTTFCLLILINGANFIDGLDGLNLGYFLLITIVIIYLENSLIIEINRDQLFSIFYITSFLLILNFLNYLYLGDSGSYLIGFIFGTFLIELNYDNYFLSPYFIALLLWYPAFENLFSIIRKKIIKKNPLQADNYHFHQLLYNFFKKNNNRTIRKFSNTISSSMIIIYNSIIFFIGIDYLNHTKILLILLTINITIYLVLYFVLKKKFNHIN